LRVLSDAAEGSDGNKVRASYFGADRKSKDEIQGSFTSFRMTAQEEDKDDDFKRKN
jgi:hypothetical protein